MGAAMESISGPRPVSDPVIAPRATAPSGQIASGAKSVPPVERTNGSQNQTTQQQDPALLRKALETLEKRLPVNVSLDITYDESINREVVRGTSKITGETVMEFPTEQMQKLIRGLREELGLTVDEQV